jgi:glycosyltransferase involved in cell wall biosynthesis
MKRKPGKQPGSPGAAMRWETADRTEDHHPEGGCSCGLDLADAADLGLPGRISRKHLVALVGIMGSQDGLDYLIQMAEFIIRDWMRDDIEFVLVGSGPEFPRLQAKVKTLGIAEYVEFTGLVSSGKELGRSNQHPISAPVPMRQIQ